MSAHLRGLSLLEVVIVVALISVLMALSLPMLSHGNAEARSALCRQNLSDMGGAVTSYLNDQGKLPDIVPLPAHEQGLSLPELVKPRLQTPNAVFCPSDETQRSHLLGTSYQWSTMCNGKSRASLSQAVGQPLITDRDAFHSGVGVSSNELIIGRREGELLFFVPGIENAELPEITSNAIDPADYSDQQENNNRHRSENGNGRVNGFGKPANTGKPYESGRNNTNGNRRGNSSRSYQRD